jgi:hypothetical protein
VPGILVFSLQFTVYGLQMITSIGGNGEPEMENRKWGTGNGEPEMGNRKWSGLLGYQL